MGEVKILPDGSLMNEENCMYMYLGKKINGKPIIPEGVEDISAFTHSNLDIYNEYEGGYYLGTEENPYKYFCKKTRSATSISLHPDTEYICSQAFYGFRGEIKFNEKLKGIGEEAFRNAYEMCSGATLIIPDGCVRIGKNAFKHNYTPPIVHLPDSITYIGKGAFPSYPPERIVASPKVLTLIGTDLFVAKALEYFKSGAQTAEDDAKWLKEIEQFKVPFVNSAIAAKNENALIFAISNNLTKKADHDKILDVAKEIGSSALKASALGSSAKPTQKEREKKAEKELDKALGLKPLSVADIKKLWEYRVDDDGTVTLTKYIGKELIPSIPTKVGKATVTRIGNQAFANNSTITVIYIPNGVVAIGDCAFEGCKKLETVELPNTIVFVGTDAFKDCKLLKLPAVNINADINLAKVNYDYCRLAEINAEWKYTVDKDKNVCAIEKYVGNNVNLIVPEEFFGVPVTIIKRDAFSSGLTFSGNGSGAQQKHNKTIKSIKLPETITTIEEYAFAGCEALTTINITLNCQVAKCAFLGCKKLAKDKRLIIINDILYRCIDASAIFSSFVPSSDTYTVVIPEGVTTIADSAFERCGRLVSVEIPSSVKVIGINAFSECNYLENICIPSSVTEIGEGAFSGCVSLTEIEIPNGVRQLRYATFRGCTALNSVIVPDSVTCIDEDAFRYSVGVVIKANKGSYAERFATDNGIAFEEV